MRELELWKLNLETSTWEAVTNIDLSHIVRASNGAVAQSDHGGTGYFLGGIIDNTTDTRFDGLADSYEVLGDSFLQFDPITGFTNSSTPSLEPVAKGNLVHIPELGKEGVLIFLAGITGPKGKVVNGGYPDITARPLSMVHVYDIAKDRWYKQKTSGSSPAPRISACTVVVAAQDKTSWSIVMYGGASEKPHGDVYGDTWVLTVPSFQWVKVDDRGEKRFDHSCHLVKKNHMLVIGGRDWWQDWYQNNGWEARRVDPRHWSCLKQGIFSSLELNTFQWTDALPVYDADYEVHADILALIGGK